MGALRGRASLPPDELSSDPALALPASLSSQAASPKVAAASSADSAQDASDVPAASPAAASGAAVEETTAASAPVDAAPSPAASQAVMPDMPPLDDSDFEPVAPRPSGSCGPGRGSLGSFGDDAAGSAAAGPPGGQHMSYAGVRTPPTSEQGFGSQWDHPGMASAMAGRAAVGQRCLVPSMSGGPSPRDRETHGGGATGPAIGFVGRGPFWTCGSAPQSRWQRGRGPAPLGHALPGSPGRAAAFVARGVLNGLGGAHDGPDLRCQPSASAPPGGVGGYSGAAPSGGLSEQVGAVISRCASLLAQALDVAPDRDEGAPPEHELTTVTLETKEQRLQWRDFLAEAVSQSCATALYVSYDVEAEPPSYAKPPPSSLYAVGSPASTPLSSGPCPADEGPLYSLPPARSRATSPPHGFQQVDSEPARRRVYVIAPHGAGWSDPGRALRSPSDAPKTGGGATGLFGGWLFGASPPKAVTLSSSRPRADHSPSRARRGASRASPPSPSHAPAPEVGVERCPRAPPAALEEDGAGAAAASPAAASDADCEGKWRSGSVEAPGDGDPSAESGEAASLSSEPASGPPPAG